MKQHGRHDELIHEEGLYRRIFVFELRDQEGGARRNPSYPPGNARSAGHPSTTANFREWRPSANRTGLRGRQCRGRLLMIEAQLHSTGIPGRGFSERIRS